MEHRLTRLRDRHAKLEAAIAQELARPARDDLRIKELKLRKLLIKDALAASQSQPQA